MSSDEDLIFSGKSAMDIRNDFQKKKRKTLRKNQTLIKNTEVAFFYNDVIMYYFYQVEKIYLSN